MRIESIEFRNIGSYGNKLQRLEYSTDGQLVLLTGVSGAGKTTVLSLPVLLLYGKMDKVPKGEIANRKNGDGYLKGVIRKGGDEYVIERTFGKSSTIKVYKNGMDIDSIGVKDAQAYIIDEIVQIPYQIFTNVVSLSLDSFKSFISMSAEDRRQIIDRVFDLESVNGITNYIKKDMKELGDSINRDNTQLFTLNKTIQDANNELLRISQANQDGNQEKIKECQDIIATQEAERQKFNENYQKIYVLYQQYLSKQQEILQQYNALNEGFKQNESQIALFANDKCPTCGHSFEGEAFKDLKTKLLQKRETLTADINQKTTEYNDKLAEVGKIYNTLQTISQKMAACSQKIYSAQATINAIMESAQKSAEYKGIQNIIKTNTDTLQVVRERLRVSSEDMDDLNTLIMLYSVEGVKKQVIKGYLPQLNDEIADVLPQLNFPYRLVFDEEFNAELYDVGDKISKHTLSKGEGIRVNFAVLCSIFKLLKRKYPSINMFNLDETLSNLDPATAGELCRYLKQFAYDMKLDVYVVTHVPMEVDLFDKVYHIRKDVFADMEEESV